MEVLKVLHIDDDPDTRFLLRELLAEGQSQAEEPVNIQCLEAASLEQAIAQHKDADLDIVLLDQRLGKDDGVELLPCIKSTWNCPVWILTGLADQRLSDRSKEKGATGVISKNELLRDGEHVRLLLLKAAGRLELE